MVTRGSAGLHLIAAILTILAFSAASASADTTPTSGASAFSPSLDATPLTSAQRYHVTTGNGWTTFRNAAGSYVFGAAANGWYFDVSTANPGGYDYGYLYGGGGVTNNPWTKCGWISDGNVTGDNYFPPASCGPGTNFVETTFASYVNCYGCGGGYLVTTQPCSDSNEYANVLPWQTTTTPRDVIGTFSPGVSQVYWRYRTKDDAFVMVQDRNLPYDDGWAFIRRACLSQVTGLAARSNVS
jgi:hypothetical protein